MENQNLNFSQIAQLFAEADQKIKNLEGENQFLQSEVNELRAELESNVPRETRAILKDGEVEDFFLTILDDIYIGESYRDDLSNCISMQVDEDYYGNEITINKDVSSYDLDRVLKDFLKEQILEFVRNKKNVILVLDDEGEANQDILILEDEGDAHQESEV